MKVLKKGRPQLPWSCKVKCTGKGNGGGGCGAKLLVEQADLYETRCTDLMGEYESFVTIQCPCCGKETDLKNVPPEMRYSLVYKVGGQVVNR